MSETVTLDVTTVEETVSVTTTDGGVVQIAVMAERGEAGTNGTNGGSTSAWNYNAKTNATSGYPGDGYLLWNNATQTSATSIIVSHLTDDDTDIELFLSFFVVNQKIFIQDRDDSSKNQVWLISGTPTVTGAGTATAYYTFPVTLVSSAGGAFTNNHSILFGQISVATNSVTSATTSDGTAELQLNRVEATFLDCVTVNSNNCSSANFIIGGSGGTMTTLLGSSTANQTITFPDASGTVALLSDITGINSGTNTGDQSSIVGITGTLAEFNTALTGADFATLAGSETLTNKTLTSPAINSATFGTAATFNATTYTFGAGAAAALSTALGTTRVMRTTLATRTSGSVLADDTLVLPVVSGVTYRVKVHTLTKNSTATVGMVLRIDHPGITASGSDTVGHFTNGGGNAGITPSTSTSLTNSVNQNGQNLSTISEVILTPSASGDVKVMWGARVPAGVETAGLNAGSYLEVTKIS
jgi:hypothetical protein